MSRILPREPRLYPLAKGGGMERYRGVGEQNAGSLQVLDHFRKGNGGAAERAEVEVGIHQRGLRLTDPVIASETGSEAIQRRLGHATGQAEREGNEQR